MPRTPPEFLDPARYPLHFEILPRYGDQDPNRHINNVAMAQYFEEARILFYRHIRDTSELPSFGGMLVGIEIDYIGQAYHPDAIELAVGVRKLGRSSWTFAKLATQGGRPVAFSQSTAISSDGQHSVPMSDNHRALFAKYLIAGIPDPA